MVKSWKWKSRGVESFALLALGLGLGFAPGVRADPPKAKKQKPQQVAPTGKEDAAAASDAQVLAEQELERMTSRSAEGLTQVQLPNGAVAMDLDGRFMHVMMAVPDGKGGTRLVCTDDHSKLKKAPAALEEK